VTSSRECPNLAALLRTRSHRSIQPFWQRLCDDLAWCLSPAHSHRGTCRRPPRYLLTARLSSAVATLATCERLPSVPVHNTWSNASARSKAVAASQRFWFAGVGSARLPSSALVTDLRIAAGRRLHGVLVRIQDVEKTVLGMRGLGGLRLVAEDDLCQSRAEPSSVFPARTAA